MRQFEFEHLELKLESVGFVAPWVYVCLILVWTGVNGGCGM